MYYNFDFPHISGILKSCIEASDYIFKLCSPLCYGRYVRL